MDRQDGRAQFVTAYRVDTHIQRRLDLFQRSKQFVQQWCFVRETTLGAEVTSTFPVGIVTLVMLTARSLLFGKEEHLDQCRSVGFGDFSTSPVEAQPVTDHGPQTEAGVHGGVEQKHTDQDFGKLVDLKAELYKKQEEFRKSKLQQVVLDKPPSKLHLKKKGDHVKVNDTLGKSNPGLTTRMSKDDVQSKLPEDEEIRNALEASRKKLEEKAALYDKLISGAELPDEEGFYMVDFQRKVIVEIEDKRREKPAESSESDEAPHEAEECSDEWVDYIDSLGRSRRCLKVDLPSMISMDEDLKRGLQPKEPDDGSYSMDFIGPMPSTVEEAPSAPTGPTHYQNVQNAEIRNHGVGYFEFSKSEEERQKQMELLARLRDQTKDQRERRETLLAKRKAALKARLDKVKRRKRLQNGETLSEDEEKEDKSDDDDEFVNIEPRPVEKAVEPAPAADQESADFKKPVKVRPWDKGKIGVTQILQPFRKSSHKEYVDKRREERTTEFAPPSFYQKESEKVQKQPPPSPSTWTGADHSPDDDSNRAPFFVDVHLPPPNYEVGRDPPPTFPVPPPPTQAVHRDPVEEMHEFFKKTWRESLATKSDTQHNLGEENSGIDDIPLPPSS